LRSEKAYPEEKFKDHVDLFTSVMKLKRKRRLDLTRVFQCIDIDGSNSMDTEELFQMGRTFNPNWTRKQCGELMLKIDRDGDGGLHCDEFLGFFGDFCEHMAAKHVDKGITAMDKKSKQLAKDKHAAGGRLSAQ